MKIEQAASLIGNGLKAAKIKATVTAKYYERGNTIIVKLRDASPAQVAQTNQICSNIQHNAHICIHQVFSAKMQQKAYDAIKAQHPAKFADQPEIVKNLEPGAAIAGTIKSIAGMIHEVLLDGEVWT